MTATPALRDRMESNVASQRTGTGGNLYEFIERNKAQIARGLPNQVSLERFTRTVLTEVRRNPRLLEATRESFMGAVMLSAQLGLEPGPLAHCYLIPRRNRKAGVTEVQFMIGYRGYIDLARRGGLTVSIDAQVVYDGDVFDFEYGLEPKLSHRPKLSGRGADLRDAVATFKDGGHSFVVLSVEDIESRRGKSAAKSDGPWVTDWPAMARKSAVRALAPFLPQNPELANAQRVDEAVRTDLASDLDEFDPPAPPDETPAVGAGGGENAKEGADDDGSGPGPAPAEPEPEPAPTDQEPIATADDEQPKAKPRVVMIVKPEIAQRRDHGCTNKNRYPTRAFANKTLRSLSAVRSTGGRVVPYLCKACGSWHLGHDPKRRGRFG